MLSTLHFLSFYSNLFRFWTEIDCIFNRLYLAPPALIYAMQDLEVEQPTTGLSSTENDNPTVLDRMFERHSHLKFIFDSL